MGACGDERQRKSLVLERRAYFGLIIDAMKMEVRIFRCRSDGVRMRIENMKKRKEVSGVVLQAASSIYYSQSSS